MEKLPQEARYAEAPSEEKNLDYFMKKMRERVTAYHNQSSQAEVKDRGGLYRNQLSTDRIKEAAAYRAEQKKQFGQSEKVQEKIYRKEDKRENLQETPQEIAQVANTERGGRGYTTKFF